MIATLSSADALAQPRKSNASSAPSSRTTPRRKVVDQVIGELAIPNASVQKGGIQEATRLLGEQRSPRLLVVDLTGIELALSAVNELAEVCEPGVTVIAIGDRNDVGLFRDLINNGVSDYLVKPIAPALLKVAAERRRERHPGRPSDRSGPPRRRGRCPRRRRSDHARDRRRLDDRPPPAAASRARRPGSCSSGRSPWRWTWSPRRACGRPSSIPAGSTACSSTAR